MSQWTNAVVKLDKVLMVLFGAGLLVAGFLAFRTSWPEWQKKYGKARDEALHPRNFAETGKEDPKGYVLVACIVNGKFRYVRMTREERDELMRRQRGR